MSRKSAAAARQQAEQLAYNRQSQTWSRMLERNDFDLSALIDLNRSLQAVKDAMDELLLLDLGEGKYRLQPDGRDELVKVVVAPGENSETIQLENPAVERVLVDELSEATQELCVDFLLRRKLRRKLMSRVFRRLNRLATAMDGDVQPPGPPKYGDLRLNCDESAVKVCAELKARQAEVLQRIHQTQEDKYRKAWETEAQPVKKREETSSGNAPLPAEEVRSTKENNATPIVASSEEIHPLPTDYEILKDYKDSYEKKVIDPRTGTTMYPLLEQEHVEDHVAIKFGAGVGATHRTMNAKEKEVEYKRWRTTLLARIPEQPTWSDLGLENRVFFPEERRKRALQEMKEAKLRAQQQQQQQQEQSANSSDEEEGEPPRKKIKSSDVSVASKGDDHDKDDHSIDEFPEKKSETPKLKDHDNDNGGKGTSNDDTPQKKNASTPIKTEEKEATSDKSSDKMNADGSKSEQGEEKVATNDKKSDTMDRDDDGGSSKSDQGEEKEATNDKNSYKMDLDNADDSHQSSEAEEKEATSDSRDGTKVVDDAESKPDKTEEKEITGDNSDGTKVDDAADFRPNKAEEKTATSDDSDKQKIVDAEGSKADKAGETKATGDSSAGTKSDDSVGSKSDKVEEKDAVNDNSHALGVADTHECQSEKNEKMNVEPENPDHAKDDGGEESADVPKVEDKEHEQSNSDSDSVNSDNDEAKDASEDESEQNSDSNEDETDVDTEQKDGEESESESSQDSKENGEKKATDDLKDGQASEDEKKVDSKDDLEQDEHATNAEEAVLPKIIRPISLTAIPSFHDQDLRRIRIVHADLMVSSIQDQAQHKLEDAMKDYNAALKAAVQINERRGVLQNQINSLQYEQRNQEHVLKKDYAVKFAVAKNRWNANRRQFEMTKLNAILPSRNGLRPMGTQMTQSFELRPDRMGICKQVGLCLADVVDSVEGIVQGVIRNDRFPEPFHRPPLPVGADPKIVERSQQAEKKARNDMNASSVRLRAVEDERIKAWKKLLKTKAEFDIPHRVYSGNGSFRNYQLNTTNCSSIPLPPLRGATVERMPQDLGARTSNIASFTPSHVTAPPASPSPTRKYSAARVRDRISKNGTVAALSKPSISKDGLYQKPTGRARKGMTWDAVKGSFVAEESN